MPIAMLAQFLELVFNRSLHHRFEKKALRALDTSTEISFYIQHPVKTCLRNRQALRAGISQDPQQSTVRASLPLGETLPPPAALLRCHSRREGSHRVLLRRVPSAFIKRETKGGSNVSTFFCCLLDGGKKGRGFQNSFTL